MRALCFGVSFLLAFLLFAVQPMATRMVLPTLGGSPAVWNTVMFTFQLLLLTGYGYAHLLTSSLTSRWQLRVHALLILGAFAFLPLAVTLTTSDSMLEHPIPHLVAAFLLQLGVPFFCLAATSPLLQSWVSRSDHPLGKTPYVLYSASNLGSFAGLFGYVGIVEPLFDLHEQSQGWSGIYMLGMLTLMFTGWRLLNPLPSRGRVGEGPVEAHKGPLLTSTLQGEEPTWSTRWIWIGLAFLPSSLSLGVTTYITTDIASIPLLWIIPLSLYLLSFVDAFRTRPLVVKICQRLAPLIGFASLLLYGVAGPAFAGAYLFQLLAFAMLAFAIHGWLASLQPSPRHLTQFYLCLSIGGALGGVLNGLVAPVIFRQAFEYPIILLAASLTAFILLQRHDDPAASVKRHLQLLMHALLRVALLTAIFYPLLVTVWGTPEDFKHLNGLLLIKAAGLGGLLSLAVYRRYANAYYSLTAISIAMLLSLSSGVVGYTTLFKDRNFFGVSRVYEDPKLNVRYFLHDTTMHGMQSLDPKDHLRPLSYYQPPTEMLDHIANAHTRPIAVIGQGIGTLKCMARKNQPIDFYEINPMVKMLAEDAGKFTYMRDCPGTSSVMLGDGRIRIAAEGEGHYGVIVIDAFSSDAIPAHLLTREALSLYFDKLAPGGVLIMHTTNRHLDLWPLLGAEAKALDLVAYGKFFHTDPKDPRMLRSFWVVMARSPKTLQPLVKASPGWTPLPDHGDRPWTDQYINMLPYFKFLHKQAAEPAQ